jgi:hypothetical protein
MVAWWWLLVAFAGGSFIGLLVAGLGAVAGRVVTPAPVPGRVASESDRIYLVPRSPVEGTSAVNVEGYPVHSADAELRR